MKPTTLADALPSPGLVNNQPKDVVTGRRATAGTRLNQPWSTLGSATSNTAARAAGVLPGPLPPPVSPVPVR